MDNDLALLKANCLSLRGYEYLKTSRFEEALEVFEEASALYKQINNDEAESKHIRITADLFHSAGEFEKSLKLYRHLLSKHILCDNTNEIGVVQNNIGLLLITMRRFNEAEESFQDALESFESCGNDLGVAEQLANLGSVYRDQQFYASAIEYYQLALEKFEKTGNFNKVSDQLSNLGYIYVMLGDKLNACNYFGRAKNLYLQNGDHGKAELAARNIAAMTNLTG